MKKHFTPKGVLLALCIMLTGTILQAQTLTVTTRYGTTTLTNSNVSTINLQRPKGNDTLVVSVSYSTTSSSNVTMSIYGSNGTNYNQPLPGIYWEDGFPYEYETNTSFSNRKLIITSAATIRSGENYQAYRLYANQNNSNNNDRTLIINLYGNDTAVANTTSGFVIYPRPAIVKPSGSNSISIECRDLNNSLNGNNPSRTWTLRKGTTVIASSNGTGSNNSTGYNLSTNGRTATMTFYKNIDTGEYTITFVKTANNNSSPGTYVQSFTIYPANMWAGVNAGEDVAAFHIIDGRFYAGPTLIFNAYPGNNTYYTTAIGRSPYPSPDSGYFYYLDQYAWGTNNNSNSGQAVVKAATGRGDSVNTWVGSLDFNGSANNNFGFVRLGMDSTTTGSYGWILGRDANNSTSNLMLGRFKSNGLTPFSTGDYIIIDSSVSVTGGAGTSNFNNGDLCIDSLGRIFAVANTSSSSTELYIGLPAGSNTILEKKWDIYDHLGNNFSGSVNGVCFDAPGGLYLSTSLASGIVGGNPTAGIYYADPATVQSQTEASSVNLRIVYPTNALEDYAGNFTDLGTNVFPNTIYTLPVKLEDITVVKQGNNANVKWITATEQNTEKFEVYRSLDGINWDVIQTVGAKGNSIEKTHYEISDPLDGLSGNILYRIRNVDYSGFGENSKVVTLKLGNNVSGVDVSLQPNPAKDYLTMTVSSKSQQDMKYLIYGQNGKVYSAQTINVQPGVQTIDISDDIKDLGLGVYLIELHVNGEMWTERFTKF